MYTSQVMRGNEELSFLVTMIFEISIDMHAFLAILCGAVVTNAFAYRLLKGDADEYSSARAAIFSSYSLLMHADGVGDRDLYLAGCACLNRCIVACHVPPRLWHALSRRVATNTPCAPPNALCLFS